MSTTYTESEVEQKIHARLTEITELAHAEADRRGYCETFDEIAELAGLPKRSSVYRVTIPVTVEVDAPGYGAGDVVSHVNWYAKDGITFTALPSAITAKVTGVGRVSRGDVERVLVFPQPEAVSASQDSGADPAPSAEERRMGPDGERYYYGRQDYGYYGTAGGWYKSGCGVDSSAAVARTWSELVARVSPAETAEPQPSVGDVRTTGGSDYVYRAPEADPAGWYLDGHPVSPAYFRGRTVAELDHHHSVSGPTRSVRRPRNGFEF